jgi:hypothetical protein
MKCDHERRSGHIRIAQDPTGVGDHAILQLCINAAHTAPSRDAAVAAITKVLDDMDWNPRRRSACMGEAMRVVDTLFDEECGEAPSGQKG